MEQLSDVMLEANALPFRSVKDAELVALTCACQLFADKPVTIFIYFIYLFILYSYGVSHDLRVLWQSRGFRSSDGKPILNVKLVSNLIASCSLPSQLAVVKTKAHSVANTDEAKMNS